MHKRLFKTASTKEALRIHIMFILALCTSALLVTATAKLYDECTLARDLRKLGVHRDQIATWVCIAFHESRLDTAAHNYGSGDHGLLQISELYWCGTGKVCGLPCSALRDDDISDDVKCAMKVHEEHTRLQGNGFLAWTVYPLYCKKNVKEYISNCGVGRQMHRSNDTSHNVNIDNWYNHTTQTVKIDDLRPPYLSVNYIYNEALEKRYKYLDSRQLRLNYKISNIDDLKIPHFEHENKISTELPESTSTTTYAIRMEVNQEMDRTYVLPLLSTLKNNLGSVEQHVSEKNKTNGSVSFTPSKTKPEITHTRAVSSTTNKPWFYTSKTYKPGLSTSTFHESSFSTNITNNPWSWTRTTQKPKLSTSESKPFLTSTTHKPRLFTTTNTYDITTEIDIFNLYLNTHRPLISTYSFAPFVGKRLNIFSEGSTTPSYPKLLRLDQERNRNYIKRQSY